MNDQPQTVFPFFVGCERSGTTLVRMMFDSHPSFAIPSESYFIPQLYSTHRSFRDQVPFPAAAFADTLAKHRWFQRWGLSAEQVMDAMTTEPPADYAQAVRRVYAMFAESAGKPCYGDKTPVYVLNLAALGALFPEGRFVHIIRDGRDVALSLREVGFGPDTVPRSALWWRRRVEAGREAGARLGAERYLEIRYEALVDDPETVLKTTCEFLDVPFDPAMLTYPDHAPTVMAPGGFRLHPHLLEPPTRGIRSWRNQMADRDLAAFEALAGDLLTELDYPPSGVRRSVRCRVRATTTKAGDATRRSVRRLKTTRGFGAARKVAGAR